LKKNNFFDTSSFKIRFSAKQFIAFYEQSGYKQRLNNIELSPFISISKSIIYTHNVDINSYLAALIADFLRHSLLEKNANFCFETVMSDKRFLQLAKSKGYRIYLYFIATENPLINIRRVKTRVTQGGHDVPHEKILSRYTNSLNLLFDAIRTTDRAYLFDNSNNMMWFCEVTDGSMIELKSDDNVPNWFIEYIERKLL
jgi:predicted ABC-type ATPase